MEKIILDKVHNSIIKIMDEIVRICDKHDIEYFLLGGTLLGAVRHKGFIPWDDDLDIGMCRSEYLRFIEICKTELNEKFILDCSEVNYRYYQPFAKIKLKNTLYIEEGVESYEGPKGIWVDIFVLDNAEKQKSIITKIQSLYMNEIRREILIRSKFCNNTGEKITRFKRSNIIKSFIGIILGWWTFIPKFEKLGQIQQNIMRINKNDNSKYLVNFGSQYGIKKQTMPRSIYFPTKKLEFEGRMYKVPNNYEYFLKRIYGDNYMTLPPVEKRITHNPKKIKFEDGEEIIF